PRLHRRDGERGIGGISDPPFDRPRRLAEDQACDGKQDTCHEAVCRRPLLAAAREPGALRTISLHGTLPVHTLPAPGIWVVWWILRDSGKGGRLFRKPR